MMVVAASQQPLYSALGTLLDCCFLFFVLYACMTVDRVMSIGLQSLFGGGGFTTSFGLVDAACM
jgi:hypothetical protein